MKKLIFLILSALSLAGCAHYTTTQSDTSYEKGIPSRTITTKVKVGTFFDAKSELAKSKAMQTDKTQSSALGGMSQETSGSNAVQVVKIVIEGAASTVK
jgi:hypothetical protein